MYTKTKLSDENKKIPTNLAISFLLVGTNNLLYTKKDITSTPIQEGRGSFLTIFQLKDKSFAGIGTDKKLYTKATLSADGCCFLNIFQSTKNESFIGRGADNLMYKREKIDSKDVQSGAGNFIDCIELDDGTFVLIGTLHKIKIRRYV